jgi:DNA-binding transcriptional LysR family regulator
MPSIDRMKEFAEVARAGSISGAARILGLPRATLSRRISGLEADLGVRLLHRRTTHLVLTTAGQELARRATRLTEDADAAWSAVQRLDDVPRGLLRVSVTGPHFLQLFTDFARDFPEVQLEVQSTTRHVDLLTEGVDVAVRIGEIKDQNLIARHLHSDRLVVVGSPSYLARNGTPHSLDDLAQTTCIVGFAGDWSPSHSWPLMEGGSVRISRRLATNEIELMRKAAMEGLGLALLPSAAISDELASGALQPVLFDLIGAMIPVNLVFADREFIDPKVRVFVDRAVPVIQKEMPKPFVF